MATTQNASQKRGKKPATKAVNAIELLKSDHRQVEEWFEKFEKTRSDDRKAKLAQQICTALTVHTAIEEDIFYPAFLEATDDAEMHNEAKVEHESAKQLIEQIEQGEPGDEMWEAKVKVLSEYIKHHVKEEEQRGGMFAEAKKAGLDLEELGAEMSERKKELMAKKQNGSGGETPSE